MKNTTNTLLIALTLAACLLLGVAGCSPSTPADPAYTALGDQIDNVATNVARAYFDAGAISMAAAIRANPEVAAYDGTNAVAAAHRVWLVIRPDEKYITP